MYLQDYLDKKIQFKLLNFPNELTGPVTGIYHPNDWIIAKLKHVDSIGIWVENENYQRVILMDKNKTPIPKEQQEQETLTTHILIRWEYIGSILRIPSEEEISVDSIGKRIGFV